MNPLIIAAEDDTTPSVRLDSVKNTFEISGWSHPEDAISFYAPVFEWLEVYVRSPNEKTDFHFNLQYYNTASAKQIFKILSLLEEISKSNKKITVYWHYDKEDIDMYSAGERYAKMLMLPFEYVQTTT